MALKQHLSLDERFRQQHLNAQDYLLPFLEKKMTIRPGMKILEIGTAEGGVLKPFVTRGCWCLGVDLAPKRIEIAKQMLEEEVASGKIDFIAQNVYDEAFEQKWTGQFDLIILKDTIEHIPDQEKFIPYIKRFLVPTGHIFFGFPPWRMPFGGHQQICRSKILGKLPWFHLLPLPLYKVIIGMANEPDRVVEELIDIKATRISLARFERIIKQSDLSISLRTLFLFNPIYRFKFGLKPREQFPLLAAIPYFKDFVTTAGWYLVNLNKN